MSNIALAPVATDIQPVKKKSGLRTRIVAALAIVAAIGGGSVLAAAPAQAATNTGSISVCFKFASNGAKWTNRVYAQYSNGTSWINLTNKIASVDGCTSFTFTNPNGYAFRFQAYENVGGRTWSGYSDWTRIYNGQSLRFNNYYWVYG
ncbi:hypothetical protein [Naasia lichenicola]|uniref:Uncharacterized protein n=1 Tax=Naasia lichenicola TaxID=2565933 RepID=A0A4S4FP09_9MICO|nr:hypothetical protein [Naasia lichenicola]THG30751.1 hypothetical protein E6C64_08920 [Naasia lichenicola]THG31988.1 hypothetical protein E6C64_08065 [Naasia lichenicola]